MEETDGSSDFRLDQSNDCNQSDISDNSDSDDDVQVSQQHITQPGMASTVLTQNVPMSSDVQVSFPMPSVSCLPPGVDMGQHLMVVNSNGDNNATRSLCLEQDGQTFILTGLNMNNPTSQTIISPNEMEDQTPSETDINQAWFTSREDKTSLQRKGHLWKQGMWSKEEVDLLQDNIILYCSEKKVCDPATVIFQMSKDERKDFYRTVAKGLNRPLFSVYRRVIRMYDNKNHVGKYTDEEIEQLKELRAVHGNDWQAIGAVMGRSASSIKDRCRLLKENCNQGKWLPVEEKHLAEAVYDLAKVVPGEMISSGLSWAAVAERVGTRSEKQCRTKWLNFLNWKEAGGTFWTREDDIALISKLCSLNISEENLIDWTEISKNWSSVRSPQWLRGKWWALKRQVPKELHYLFPEMSDYLYQKYVQKVCVKSDKEINRGNLVSASSLIDQIKPEPTIVSLPPSPIIQPATIKSPTNFLNSMGTTLTTASTANSFVEDLATLLGPHGSIEIDGMSPLIQTLGALPHNPNGLTPEQAFILSQAGIPITATIGPGQIFVQSMGDHNLRMNEGVTLQLNSGPQIIISTNGTGLGSLVTSSTCPENILIPLQVSGNQINLEEDKDELEDDDDDDQAFSEEGGGAYVESYDDEDARHMDGINENDCYIDKGNRMIVSDVMLAASGSPSDIDKDSLDHVPGSSES